MARDTEADDGSTEEQTNDGTDRSYRVPADDADIDAIIENARDSGRELDVSDSPAPGKKQVKTTDGDDHVERLKQYECSDRWEFPWTDEEYDDKYRPLEIRGARQGGIIVRCNNYPVDDPEVLSVRVYFKVQSKTRTDVRDTPGHLEPQLSTNIRNAVEEAREELEPDEPEADAGETAEAAD